MRFGFQNRLRLAREIEFLKANSMKADCSAFIAYIRPRRLKGAFDFQENAHKNFDENISVSDESDRMRQKDDSPTEKSKRNNNSYADKKFSRIAIVASKRIGGATVRNRARRIMREVFRACAPKFPEPIDAIIFMRAGWYKFPLFALQKKFGDACKYVAEKIARNPDCLKFVKTPTAPQKFRRGKNRLNASGQNTKALNDGSLNERK